MKFVKIEKSNDFTVVGAFESYETEINEIIAEYESFEGGEDNFLSKGVSDRVPGEYRLNCGDFTYYIAIVDASERTWLRDGYKVAAKEFDYDLLQFHVIENGKITGTISPDSITDMIDLVIDLDDGEDVSGWEDGNGNVISIGGEAV